MNNKAYIQSGVGFNEKHDAFFDREEDIWLEKKCNDPDCEFCNNRPNKPSEVEG